jgi:hypothetical protein
MLPPPQIVTSLPPLLAHAGGAGAGNTGGRNIATPGAGGVALGVPPLGIANPGMMHTGMYADELGIPELTLESSWRGEAAQRVQAHVELVCALVDELATPRGA